MAVTEIGGIPHRDPMVIVPAKEGDENAWRIATTWLTYLTNLRSAIDQTPRKAGGLLLTGQVASLGATDISGGAAAAGLYRLDYYARVTTAAGTSSSLTITIDWTDTGVAQSQSFAAMTANTVTTQQSDSKLFYADKNAAIRISAAYASVGAPVMSYSLRAVLERMP